jgi:hypothetical protein
MVIGRRSRRESIEGLLEEHTRLFTLSLASVDEAEVGDHLSLVHVVAERVEDVPRLLEVLDSLLLGAALRQGEAEAIEGERLSLFVAEVADDLERDPVLLGRVDRVALAAELRPELVELDRAAPTADRIQPVDGSGVSLECTCEQLGTSAGCSRRPYAGVGPDPRQAPPHIRVEAPCALPDPEPVKSSSASRSGVRRGHETMCDGFADLEAPRRGAPADNEQEEEERSERDEGDNDERKHEQEPAE